MMLQFAPAELSVLAYANGFTLWHYRSPHVEEDILRPGYWTLALNLLREGDRIMVTLPTLTPLDLWVSEVNYRADRVAVRRMLQAEES